MFRYLPEQASEVAPKIDWIHNVITDLSVFFTVLIVGAMLYFAIRYRKKGGVDHETPRLKGSHTLEVVWTVIPTLICIYIAYYGVVYYQDLRVVPKDAMSISVTGQKWQWLFEYENGKKTNSSLTVPVNKPVRLVMKSQDVLHSFFVPSMRVKSDVLPSHYTYISFTPVKTGKYPVYCTEYCGDMHWNMLADLNVVSESEFDQWLNDNSEELKAKGMSPAALGKKLYTEKGCNACHSLNGMRIVGPSFQKLWGKTRKFTDGGEAVADENYIRNSILNPNSQIVETYQPNLMPAYEGQLNDKEIMAIASFIKTLDGSQAEAKTDTATQTKASKDMTPEERGKALYASKACSGCHSLDGSKVVGPTFKGLYGKDGEHTEGTYIANDDYLKESILKPNAKIVKGYAPAMPVMPLTDEEVSDLIAYIKTIK